MIACPAGWRRMRTIRVLDIDVEYFELPNQGLSVGVSHEIYEDGKRFLHVSMSRRSRLPSYEDMKRVKHEFIGDDRAAYQVFPKLEEHVNLHENCLHLWCPLNGDPFPPQVQANGATP